MSAPEQLILLAIEDPALAAEAERTVTAAGARAVRLRQLIEPLPRWDCFGLVAQARDESTVAHLYEAYALCDPVTFFQLDSGPYTVQEDYPAPEGMTVGSTADLPAWLRRTSEFKSPSEYTAESASAMVLVYHQVRLHAADRAVHRGLAQAALFRGWPPDLALAHAALQHLERLGQLDHLSLMVLAELWSQAAQLGWAAHALSRAEAVAACDADRAEARDRRAWITFIGGLDPAAAPQPPSSDVFAPPGPGLPTVVWASDRAPSGPRPEQYALLHSDRAALLTPVNPYLQGDHRRTVALVLETGDWIPWVLNGLVLLQNRADADGDTVPVVVIVPDAKRNEWLGLQHSLIRGRVPYAALVTESQWQTDGEAARLLQTLAATDTRRPTTLDQSSVAEDYARMAAEPDAPQHHQRLGERLLVMGNVRAAYAAFNEAVELAPGSAEAMHGHAVAAWRWQGTHAALPLVEQALAADPASRPARRTYARILFVLGRWDEAVAQFEQAAEGQELDAETLYLMGLAREQSGDAAAAAKLWRAAQALPSTPEVARRVARELEDGGSG